MLEFLKEAEPAPGSHERYKSRIDRFLVDGEPHPRLRHHGLWLLHNLVAHPILAFVTTQKAAEFHELTSQWLNKKPPMALPQILAPDRPKMVHKNSPRGLWLHTPRVPPIKNRGAWVLHNVVAHVAIGVLPCKATFDFHDKTATAMNVPGWV